MNLVLPLFGFFVLTFVAAFCWWIMARRPEQWASWVEKENSFWVERHLISATFAARMKRWETGKALKALLAITTVAGVLGLALAGSVVAKAISLEHRKLRMPYNPALLPKPAIRPATNRPPTKIGTTVSPANRPATNHPPVKPNSLPNAK